MQTSEELQSEKIKRYQKYAKEYEDETLWRQYQYSMDMGQPEWLDALRDELVKRGWL